MQKEVIKSGFLAKTGKRDPRYNRFFFRLKGDVLSYFTDTTNFYFPHGQIDLRYAISCDITDRNKDSTHFEIVTSNRTYNLRGDSAPSAKEWVKAVQKVIFRARNDGDSVKISILLSGIVDVEVTNDMLEFAETCKIRVCDSDEMFVVDEVCARCGCRRYQPSIPGNLAPSC